ncbi:MAG: hypothetical protein LBV42_01265 [Methanobrevibacter sp.]|jgi:hypothetical protein|nr:hypothetical protein [Methanobrevibacter sp.]
MNELVIKNKTYVDLNLNNLAKNSFDFGNFEEIMFIISSKPRSAALLYLM